MAGSLPPPALTQRIADFLQRYPPFSYLTPAELRRVASLVSVQYVPPQGSIFAQGEQPRSQFFVVYKGAVRLYREEQGEHLVDQLDEGDLFGVLPLLSDAPYIVSARGSEESLLYAIPLQAFRSVIDDNARVARYFASTFASHLGGPFGKTANPYARQEHSPIAAATSNELTTVPVRRPALTVHADVSIKEAALQMSLAGVGSVVVVDESQHPIGIVTDRDFRKTVVTGQVPNSARVDEVMHSPVETIAPDSRVVDVQLAMVRHRIHHLVVTLDGSNKSSVVGVLSNRDLLLALGTSPAAIVREISRARNANQLRHLRNQADSWLQGLVGQRGSVYAAARILTEINDELTRRCLRLSELELNAAGRKAPSLSYCWLALGSHARGEQLLRTDQDHAIVIEDGSPSEVQQAKDYYLDLADRTSSMLETVGYERCTGDVMAANSAWCLSLSEWKTRFTEWLSEPGGSSLLSASTLLDRRPVHGDEQLGKDFVEWTVEQVRDQRLFLALLSKAALDNPPPLSFFRSFVVERSGEHKDEFDIKQRAMLPLADAARVLTYQLGIPDPSNTVARFDRLAEAEPQNRELFVAAAQAYDTLMQFRARQGLSEGGNGRYFQIHQLGKLERLQLRNAFGPIQEVLSALKLRFQVTMLTT